MSMAKKSPALLRVMQQLRHLGVLLLSDAALPSVAGLVAEEPIRGSWWAHPKAHAIVRIAEQVASHRDVLTTKLISGKVTFVQRKLWSPLFAVATSREAWQLQGLSPLAHSLLSAVQRKGLLRTDSWPASTGTSAKALGEAARELERKLLVYGEEIHTERGAHAKQLESWDHLARRLRLTSRDMNVQTAKGNFEEIVTALKAEYRTATSLPWKKI